MAKKKRDDDDDTRDDDDEDPSFTDKQRSEIGRLVNAAVTGTIERKLGPKINEAVGATLEGFRTSLVEDLRKGMGQQAQGDDKTKTKDQGGQQQAAPDPEVAKMRAELQAMKDRDKQREVQEQSRERDDKIGAHLKAIGVEPNRMRGAIAVLRDAVKKGENGYTMKVDRDGFEEDLDLAKGVKAWAETDEGKSYRAETGKKERRETTTGGSSVRVGAVNVVGGSGSNGNGKGRSNTEQAQREQVAEKRQAGLDKLANAVGSLTGGANIDMG